MCELVGVQVRLLIESLVAARVRADVRLLAGVRAQMSSQVEVEREFFAAQLALERLLAGVYKLMPLQL